jgi:hypothetical protein
MNNQAGLKQSAGTQNDRRKIRAADRAAWSSTAVIRMLTQTQSLQTD